MKPRFKSRVLLSLLVSQPWSMISKDMPRCSITGYASAISTRTKHNSSQTFDQGLIMTPAELQVDYQDACRQLEEAEKLLDFVDVCQSVAVF